MPRKNDAIEIIFTKEANDNLQNIRMYYQEEFDDETADKVIDSIMGRIQKLKIYPMSGSKTISNKLNDKGYRRVVSGKYIIIYLKANKSIYIMHIYRESQDY